MSVALVCFSLWVSKHAVHQAELQGVMLNLGGWVREDLIWHECGRNSLLQKQFSVKQLSIFGGTRAI